MRTFISTLLTFSVITLSAQNETQRLKHFNVDKAHLALEGYDPISYFENKPVKGKSTLKLSDKGVVYYFVTQAHLDAFKKEPAKYEPQYGGWCAYAMGATGEKVSVDPLTYKVKDGKLYLFYNAFFNNTLPKWNANEAELKKKADAAWAKTINQ
ncbi:MAG: YHS domain-containing (seleno)protein [Chitinophagales bacterium]|nr:YHS domain-containing (seleno)protein [Chitinophagales bacterium]